MNEQTRPRLSVLEALEQSRADCDARRDIEDLAPHMERWQRMVDEALAEAALADKHDAA